MLKGYLQQQFANSLNKKNNNSQNISQAKNICQVVALPYI